MMWFRSLHCFSIWLHEIANVFTEQKISNNQTCPQPIVSQFFFSKLRTSYFHAKHFFKSECNT